MSQGNLNNPAASSNLEAPSVEQAAKQPNRSYRVALLLGALAICLYVGSIAWFYVSRGAA